MVGGQSWPLEPQSDFSKRAEMWEWMVKCLKKKDEKGPYSHLVEQTSRYDVASLYESILHSVDIQNPFVFWDAFEKFVNSSPEKGEDIFTYFVRIEKLAKTLTIRDPDEVGLRDVKLLAEWAIRLKMLVSTKSFSTYKGFSNKLQMKKPSKWITYTKEQIIDELKVIHDNNVQVGASTAGVAANSVVVRGRSRSRGPPDSRIRRKSASRSASRGPPENCPSGVCWSESGDCPYTKDGKKCTFPHQRNHGAYKKEGGSEETPNPKH